MPKNHAANASKKKKKKGPIPAHQNKFAFRHNPKSKTTEKILSSPNVHVCRRCHDKIEWRKQYRKYKPRTQPGKCNICSRKNVMAAYHSICDKCTQHSTKAKALLQEWNQPKSSIERELEEDPVDQQDNEEEEGEEGENTSVASQDDERQCSVVDVDHETADQDASGDNDMNDVENEDNDEHDLESEEEEEGRIYLRVCAMCVKEPALPASDDEADDDTLAMPLPKLSLRQRRTLERLEEREYYGATATSRAPGRSNNHPPPTGSDDEEEEEEEDENELTHSQAGDLSNHKQYDSPEEHANEDEEDEKDPFLIAVGGAENLLTGEAYQRKRLEELRLSQQEETL